MTPRRLGRSDMLLSPIGFGAFKIGRNQGTKYAEAYALPSDAEADALIARVVDLGVTLIDTAPAYGSSEARVGSALERHGLRERVRISTKVGERFEDGRSTYDFSVEAITRSVTASLAALRTDRIDCLVVHAPREDAAVLRDTPVTDALRDLRERGVIRTMGFSGYTHEAFRLAIAEGYDALMVEYHPLDTSHRATLENAASAGVGVLVKKALASGRIPASEAIPFALAAPAVTSVVIGSLNAENIASAIELAAGS
jgi:aryl-alcohol dehydrogenase-like predicted oxidoreductase